MRRPSAAAVLPVLLASVACAALATTACVSRSEYRELERERDELRARSEELRQRDRALQSRVDDLGVDALALGRPPEATAAVRRALEETREELAEDLEREVELGLIAVRLRETGLEVEVPDRVLFESDSARLSERGTALLARVADDLEALPYQVVVAGYTDDVPVAGDLARTYPTNWDLAAARASRVVSLLEAAGVPGHRLVAVSFGQQNPVAANDSPAGRARNRRIEIRVRPITPGP